MTRRTSHLSEELYAYLLDISLRELPVMRRLREETASMEQANMQIGPEQGQFMALLVELIGARSVLEVGTFTEVQRARDGGGFARECMPTRIRPCAWLADGAAMIFIWVFAWRGF